MTRTRRAAAPPAPRRGFSAIELLICSAILAAAFLPVYTSVQGSQTSAYLNELNVLGRRRAYRILNYVRSQNYGVLQNQAQGDAPPSGIRGLPEEGREIAVLLPTGEQEAEDEAAPGPNMLVSYAKRVDSMRYKCFFHELSPGLARISVVVRWTDPTNRKPRDFVALTYVEDPYEHRGPAR